MNSDAAKELIETYVDAFNRGDIDAVCQCFAPNALSFGVLGWGEISKVRPIWEQLTTSFRMQVRVDSIIAEGNVVAVRLTESGTFAAPFGEIAPTGKSYDAVAMEWFEVSDQGIVRRWGSRDTASVLRQLGIPLA